MKLDPMQAMMQTLKHQRRLVLESDPFLYRGENPTHQIEIKRRVVKGNKMTYATDKGKMVITVNWIPSAGTLESAKVTAKI